MRSFASLTFIASLALALPSVFAQGVVTGSIAGHVTDSTGAPVSGATITITNIATGIAYNGVTTAEGFYLLRYLPTGTYNVGASQTGFQRAIHPNVLLSAASNPTVNFELTLGAVSQSITVSEAGAMVEAQTADRSNVVDTVRLDNFPSQTGNIFGLTFNTVGVQPTSSQKSYTFDDNANSSSISINGGQFGATGAYGGSNMTLVDGVYDRTNYNGGVVGLIPSSESVAEMKIVTNAYSAEYGNTTGGAIISITKSGTNQFHGMAWDNTRTTGLAANQFERNLAGQPRLGVHFWQPGGAIGGPIKKNKIFFFFEMQSIISHTPKSYIGQVPTQAQRTGDFSQSYYNLNGQPALQVIYDPFTVSYNAQSGQYTRQPFSNNIIPSNRINPVAGSSFWNYIPAPNSTGDPITLGNNYTPTDNNTAGDHQREYVSRVDWNINDMNRITFRYTRNSSIWTDVQFYPTGMDPNAANGGIRANHNGVIDYTRTLSPTTVLDIRTGMERYENSSYYQNGCGASAAQLGFSSTFISQALVPCAPVFSFGGSTLGSTYFSGAGSSAPSLNLDQMNTIAGTLSKTIGRHTVKFGATGLLERFNNANPGNAAGSFSFAVTGSSLNPQVSSPSSGNPVASFLLGVGTAGIDLNSQPARQSKMAAFYVQDDINVTPKLKVNLGLRWDWDSSLTDRFNAMTGAFDVNSASPLAAQVKAAAGASNCPACANLAGGLTFPGVNGQPRSPYDSSHRNFGPRLGAAYAFDSKTVIRAGWGLFYGAAIYDPGSAGFSQSTTSVLYDSSYMPVNLINNPFPNGIIQPVGSARGLMTNVGTSVAFVAPHAREPRSQQFSFDVQREVGWKVLLSAGYIYNGVSREPVSRDLDALTNAQLLLGSAALNPKVTNPFAGLVGSAYSLNAATIATSSLITPYPQFTAVNENNLPLGDMAYHALQIQANKRFSAGLSFSVAYTRSTHMGRYRYQNAGDPIDSLQKSLDYWDMPNLLVINEAWELPFGRGRLVGGNMPKVLDYVVGGWMFNGNIRFESGAPYVLAANAIPVPGVDRNAPNQSLNQWVNPAAFTLNTNPYSLVGWSQSWKDLRLPWLHNTDLQLEKYFQITERVRFALLTNWVNAFNHPQFWNSPGACSSPSASCFGRIAGYQSQTNLPRQIQLGGKITF